MYRAHQLFDDDSLTLNAFTLQQIDKLWISNRFSD